MGAGAAVETKHRSVDLCAGAVDTKSLSSRPPASGGHAQVQVGSWTT